MDASELLGGEEPFVADTSAWRRPADLPDQLGSPLQQAILDDRLAEVLAFESVALPGL